MNTFFRAVKAAPLSVKFSLTGLALVVLMVCFPAVFAPYDPNEMDLLASRSPPVLIGGSIAHPFGTDQLGRDLLSRCLHGLQVSVGIAIVGLIIGTTLGVLLGLVSGYYGGWVDRIIMALVDFQLAVPFTLLILMGLVLFGSGIPVLMAFIGLAKWETYARITRAVVLSAREHAYVEASVAMHASTPHILYRHILPNIAPVVVVLMTLNFPSILMLESSLSFLGIGVQPPTATLGRMVGEGKNFLMTIWWVAITPAAVILCVSLMIQCVGDWLRERFDVRTGS